MPALQVKLVRRGFYPKGNGAVEAQVTCLGSGETLPAFDLTHRGQVRCCRLTEEGLCISGGRLVCLRTCGALDSACHGLWLCSAPCSIYAARSSTQVLSFGGLHCQPALARPHL